MIVLKAKEIPKIIKNGSFIGIDGFVGIGVPEEILLNIEESYLTTGSPNSINIIFAASFGDGKTRGLNRIAHEGLIKKVIGGHWGLAPNLAILANQNKLEGYNLPQGVIAQMFRDMAANKPGTISKVGIGTFVDSDLEGGKINSITKEDIVSKINILGEDFLFFKAPKLDIALLRGTTADEDGNISYENEALFLEGIHIATATKNAGGKVIVQVERIVKKGSINPKEVKIPGILVDYVVPVEDMNKKSDKAEQILQWLENMEQESINQSLDYKFSYDTDIADCYGSIYTHSIAWAIETIDIAKAQRDGNLLGNKIDTHIIREIAMKLGKLHSFSKDFSFEEYNRKTRIDFDFYYNEIKKLYDFRAQKYMAHSNFMVKNLNTVKNCTESIVLKLFNVYGNTD